MRAPLLVLPSVALVVAVGCSSAPSAPAPEGGPLRPTASTPGNGPSGGNRPDPDLVGLPDMQVRQDMLGGQWLVRDESFTAEMCSVAEGGVTPGDHRVVRFTVGVANIGDADLFVGDPNTHFDQNGVGDGTFEYATCHQHFHFRHYVEYALIGEDGHVWRAAKRGFCMLDTDPNPAWMGEPPRQKIFDNCGAPGVAGYQGISHGWTDTYRWYLGGQYFVLDGGDGQAPIPPGRYTLRITANPPFAPQPGEPCPYQDSHGLCHTLPESNYDNNVASITLDIPDHPGRSGVGPASNLHEPHDDHGGPGGH